MEWILGPLRGIAFLSVMALLFSAPVILIVLIARRRLSPWLSRSLMAAAFGASIAYVLWRIEWNDLWRHGVPPIRYLLLVYASYVAAFAAAGWLLGVLMTPRSGRPRPRGLVKT